MLSKKKLHFTIPSYEGDTKVLVMFLTDKYPYIFLALIKLVNKHGNFLNCVFILLIIRWRK